MGRYFKTFEKCRDKILKQDNIVGIGVGHKQIGNMYTKQLSIVVLVKEKRPLEKLKRNYIIPRKIDGIDTDVLEVGCIKTLNLRTEYMRPALPGCSIGHYKISAGTFGAVVYDRKTG